MTTPQALLEEPTLPQLCFAITGQPHTKLRAVLRSAPAELETIIDRCLEKEPEQRYRNVAEVQVLSD